MPAEPPPPKAVPDATPPSAPRRERLLSVPEFAQLRGCSEKTIWRAIWAGKLPVIRTGRRVHVDPRLLWIDLG